MMIHCCKIQSQSITVYSTIDIIEEVDEGMEDDTKLRDVDVGKMLIVCQADCGSSQQHQQPPVLWCSAW